MKSLCLGAMCAVLVLALSLGSAPAAAQSDVDWDTVKRIWNTLTVEEQEGYNALMEEIRIATTPSRSPLLTPGDTCGAATPEIGTIPYADGSDTTGQADDYNLGADGTCAGGGSQFGGTGTGPDTAYLVRTDLDCDVNVNMAPPAGVDMGLYVVTDCAALAASCEGVDDAGGGGVAEDVGFSATAGTDYFIITDGFNGSSGPFNLTITETTATGCTLVPVELHSFSID
ncbi:MAG: hypothetical protein K0U98_21830 [Deltaproteobacteria bacterium]|nr:hypothetical protein [Deltaproteobacteria bacterium]